VAGARDGAVNFTADRHVLLRTPPVQPGGDYFDLLGPFGVKRRDHQLKQVPGSEIDEATYSVPSHRVEGSRDHECVAESLVEGVIALSDTTGLIHENRRMAA
jgi:hypothetical protein